MKYYAGIGSRQTPQNILNNMTILAASLDARSYILRSGGAKGADKAFEAGAKQSIILRPKHATGEARAIAASFHPAWHNCDEYARNLHGRNAQIILGEKLNSPVDFVLCWTPNETRGGTSLGIKIARHNNIPVYNFAVELKLEEFVAEYLK